MPFRAVVVALGLLIYRSGFTISRNAIIISLYTLIARSRMIISESPRLYAMKSSAKADILATGYNDCADR